MESASYNGLLTDCKKNLDEILLLKMTLNIFDIDN